MTNTHKAPEASLAKHARGAVSSVGAVLALALLPKCPLCVAAYLVGLGVSVSAAQSAAPFVRPAAWALAIVASLALAAGIWRSRKRPTPSRAEASDQQRGTCCDHFGNL
jgi:hypothetical protein